VFSGDASSYFKRGLASFLDEARRLAAFARQGNIVAVHDTLETNNTAYIVMEYLEGRTLKELLREKGRLGFTEAMSVITPVLDALSAVHGAGIIHRDVAPDNIFIRPDGSVVLIDFGAARTFAKDANRSMTVVLKPGYAPIEQYLSKGSQGPWTDVYATAATLYRMLTGTVPEESIQRSRKDNLVLPSGLGVAMPPAAEAALMAALAAEPEQRTRDVATLKAGLSGRQPQAPTRPAPTVAAATRDTPTAAPPPPAASAVETDAVPVATPADGEKSNAPAITLAVMIVAIIAVVVLFIALLQPFDSSAPPDGSDTMATNGQAALPSIESVGQRVEFGTRNGKPIAWRVLAVEDGRALVISEHILENKPYNKQSGGITWETCSLRQYLNGEFLEKTFSADERSCIDAVTNQNPDNRVHGTDGGNPTEDRVFLLSIDEAKKYFISNGDGAATNLEDDSFWWWLRSQGHSTSAAAFVGVFGIVNNGGYPTHAYDGGVRPALWLNLAANGQTALPSVESVGQRVEFGSSSGDGSKLVKEGLLVVGSDCDYPPFISLEGEQPVGFEYELMQAIAADMGLELEYLEPQNFDTLIASVRGGEKMDLAVSSLAINDDQESVNFCIPYFYSDQACVTLASKTYTSANDLANKTVGAQSGTTGADWAIEHLPGITMKLYNQTGEGLAALRAGDIEALFFDASIAEYQLATNYPDMKVVEVISTAEQYGFAVSKDNPELEAQVNASLRKLIDNGIYERIFKKYFPNLETSIR
jgi:ABC-type amino acid transport substrate-binding protein/serine/threonine protein kinase